ncbi:DUF2744 domain-containing protein [Rhodococcus pyridinivorans]|uniref:phage gene 29 protein family protein n=1 Tax=Rhodococcus pyridinivorans TaxID=103816 RepID=UPI002164AD56|nr:DUF2744 domain-containing protein [Rhodococcus pyridinivorans]UVT24982.1 DUF2744 domain-containing protein [Rhodococcus pyridinivorans]
MSEEVDQGAQNPVDVLQDLPTRENCDPNNPEEAFLWMFVGLPGVNGASMIMGPDYYRQVSKQLWELGARPVEEPIKHLERGRWVYENPDDEPEPVQEMYARLAAVQRAQYEAKLRERGLLPPEEQ